MALLFIRAMPAPPSSLEDHPIITTPTTTTSSTRETEDEDKSLRGPPLGDPSLSYLSPESDFIRLPSSSKRPPRGVAILNGDTRRQRSTRNKENTPTFKKDQSRPKGKEPEEDAPTEGSECRMSGKAERILRIPNRGKSCVLTDGFVPLLQTDRLAIESIGMSTSPPVYVGCRPKLTC